MTRAVRWERAHGLPTLPALARVANRRMQSSERIHFPYMFYARTEGLANAYCLSQSGMPMADPSFLASAGGIDISPPLAHTLPEFEKKVAHLFGFPPERVIATVGASAAMMFCAMRWFGRGARVVTELPSYEPFRALPDFFGADVRVLARRHENDWTVEPDDVARALEGAENGHVFLSNPHNPSGALLEKERIVELARVAERANGVLVVCEVYGEFLPNERRVHAAALAPNAVSIGSLTKAYGLGGLRAGWILLGEGLRHQVNHVRDMSFLGYVEPPSASLVGASVALDHLAKLLQPLRQVEAECRPIWEEWLRETDGIDCFLPEFGIIAFPKLDGIEDTIEFARFLSREYDVAVVAGEYFGQRGHIRVGCGVPRETLVEALSRLGQGLEAWRAGTR